ncbi:MAG: hypothetical protein JWN36_3252 [Microbacteriaceae bacterium]|nr:hypothetical protein [Microbacteriaceae bacterium]
MTGSRSPQTQYPYAVPFRVDRDAGPRRYLLTNTSEERLDGIALSLLGQGVMPASPPRALEPGETLEVLISARDLARSTVLVVRWFRPTGEEFLWRVSF